MKKLQLMSDVPDTIIKALEQIKFEKLHEAQRAGLIYGMINFIQQSGYPYKSADVESETINTIIPAEMIDTINHLDFKKMTSAQVRVLRENIIKRTPQNWIRI